MESNNSKHNKNFFPQIVSLVIITNIFIISIITYLNIDSFRSHMTAEIKEKKVEFLNNHKNKIYERVKLVDNAIKYHITKIESNLKKSLKERVKTSLEIANFIYNKQKGKISDEEIKKRIANHLSSITFNQKRGYYFTYDNSNNIVLGHPIKKFIGKDMSGFNDLKGQNLVQLYKKSLEKNKFAFSHIYFRKPSDINNEYPKIICVSKFKPLNIVIGTGEYLDIVEKQMKEFITDRFHDIKRLKKDYLFILDLHNIKGGKDFATMLLNPNKEDLVGQTISSDLKDYKGKKFREEFLKGLEKDGEIYTKYWYKKPNNSKPKLKMTYFYLQKDWNWIIASGFYFEDLNYQIKQMENEMEMYTSKAINHSLIVMLGIIIFVIIIGIYISKRIDNVIKKHTNKLVEYKNHELIQEKLIQDQLKHSQMGLMIGNIAHQWRQPLSVISTSATGMLMQQEFGLLDDDKLVNSCNSINNSAQFLSKTIDTFTNYIKEKKELKTVILQDVISQIIDLTEAALKNNYINLVHNIDNSSDISITMVSGELSQVMINIINNAKDALVEQNISEKLIKINILQQNNEAIISIEDNAGGIPSKIINEIFNPYFTTKHKSQGTGLGLYMSKNIIEKSLNGILEVSNTKNGAIFTIKIPLNS